MDLTTCKLYRIQRKRDLAVLLKIENIKKIGQISNSYIPYIANETKKRLIEPVESEELKKIQKNIQLLLKEIKYNDNVFSGVPGKSYIDNGKYHIGCKNIVALDISKFFPNINREKVYNFFKYKMENSSDVAKILTDLCTIDLRKINNLDKNVIEYINEKKIRFMNHIPTGSSISCILSYLVNYIMFDEIDTLCREYNCKMSVYVDDIVISSSEIINNNLISKVIAIIKNNGYRISKSKLKHYKTNEFKRVTGSILSKDGKKLVVPNKIKYRRIKITKNTLLSNEEKERKRNGYDNVIKQIKLGR